jgi:hypothetical protein
MVGLIIIFGMILLMDIPGLQRAHNKKMIFLYSSIMMIGFILSLLLFLDKAPTAPNRVIGKIVKSIIGDG